VIAGLTSKRLTTGDSNDCQAGANDDFGYHGDALLELVATDSVRMNDNSRDATTQHSCWAESLALTFTSTRR
jgi:hypothetical protein